MESQIKDAAKIADFQQKALELGYKPGPIDGDAPAGGTTEAAVLDVRNNINRSLGLNLPLKPTVDAQLLQAMEAAPPKPVSVRQSIATAEDIEPRVEAVKQTRLAKFWAKVGTALSIVSAIPVGMISNLGDAVETLTPVKSFLNEFLSAVQPLTVIFFAIVAVAVVSLILFIKSKQAERAMVESYRGGTVLDDNKAQPTPTEAEKAK